MTEKTLNELANTLEALANEVKKHQGKALYSVHRRLKLEVDIIRKEDEAREGVLWAKRSVGLI